MKTIKAQICKCGENIFEDDTHCINCGKKVDKRKFKIEEIAEIHEEKYPVIPQKILKVDRTDKVFDNVTCAILGKQNEIIDVINDMRKEK